ncbi:hypothetical protein WAI453_011104 [Rhynchosporium graminicola]
MIDVKQFEPQNRPSRETARPGQSFASYQSARSSLRASGPVATKFSLGFYSGLSHRSPTSSQQPPAYYSAKSSLVANINNAAVETLLDQELNWSGKENGGQHVEYTKGG